MYDICTRGGVGLVRCCHLTRMIGLIRWSETWLKNTVPTELLWEKNTVRLVWWTVNWEGEQPVGWSFQTNERPLHVIDWLPLIDKSNKRLDTWKGNCMSIAGRSTLIGASLNNSPIYHMSIYLLPKTTVSKLDKIRRSFFWQGGGTKKKYHLLKWEKVCRSKKKGGLGIQNLKNEH